MEGIFESTYHLARLLFLRGMGLMYVIAFAVAINQFIPLLGEKGLEPVRRFTKYFGFSKAPSIFQFFYTDWFFKVVAWTGLILSFIALFGLVDKAPWWISALVWLLLWIIYLSIVNVGQTFYSFGWESMLLEAGFLAIFVSHTKLAAPVLVILLIRWMLFRLEFGAGMIKLRGDPCWDDLTCLYYHYETQPMPNPLSWFFHQLPLLVHRLGVLFSHFAQLIVPFFLFFPQPIAAIAGGIIIFSQLLIGLSGNFSFLNAITIILAFSAFSDGVLLTLFPFLQFPITLAHSTIYSGVIVALIFLIGLLSIRPAANLISKRQLMNASFEPFHLVNTYGAFGSITKQRYEIIIEGTAEAEITAQTKWKVYEFKGKPGNPRRMPAQFAPYHLRLDWLMWFAAFSSQARDPWFFGLVEKLLQNDQAILKLIRHNPFPNNPPKFIRARLYRYKFTTAAEKRLSGRWWNRKLVGEYLPPVSSNIK